MHEGQVELVEYLVNKWLLYAGQRRQCDRKKRTWSEEILWKASEDELVQFIIGSDRPWQQTPCHYIDAQKLMFQRSLGVRRQTDIYR